LLYIASDSSGTRFSPKTCLVKAISSVNQPHDADHDEVSCNDVAKQFGDEQDGHTCDECEQGNEMKMKCQDCSPIIVVGRRSLCD